jgi:hypothetical protein
MKTIRWWESRANGLSEASRAAIAKACAMSVGCAMVLPSCYGSEVRQVEDPRPAEVCLVVGESRRLHVFQEIGVGCAVLPVAPDWRGDWPRSRGGDFTQDGVGDATPVLFVRVPCEEARAMPLGVLPAELGLEPHGFLRVSLVAEGQALLSVSLDFLAEGSPEPQRVRIRDLFVTWEEGIHDHCAY